MPKLGAVLMVKRIKNLYTRIMTPCNCPALFSDGHPSYFNISMSKGSDSVCFDTGTNSVIASSST